MKQMKTVAWKKNNNQRNVYITRWIVQNMPAVKKVFQLNTILEFHHFLFADEEKQQKKTEKRRKKNRKTEKRREKRKKKTG